jgi:hypothetical protein
VTTVLRVLSGLGGAALFIFAGIFTAGTALVAPLGMLWMKRLNTIGQVEQKAAESQLSPSSGAVMMSLFIGLA